MTGIINYGAGNIYSVLTAVKKCGGEAFVIESVRDFSKAGSIILPGVGAFADGMENLEKSDMGEKLAAEINSGKPFLGICLGLQLLFSHSEEGGCKGLNLIGGGVKKFVFPSRRIKIPHMGWSKVDVQDAGEILFKGIPPGTYFYFAHSYYAVPENKTVVASKTFYGREFASAVKIGNIAGVQFHPEKSGDYGLMFIKNFLEEKWLQ